MVRISTLLFSAPIFLASCLGLKDDREASCAPPVVGKIVSTHDPCAGVVIQVTGGAYEDSQLQESYTDSQGNTFTKVFRVANPCEMSFEDQAWLADEGSRGVEFTFIFLPPAIDDMCPYCKIGVELPEVSHRIVRVLPDCNDIIAN